MSSSILTLVIVVGLVVLGWLLHRRVKQPVDIKLIWTQKYRSWKDA